MFGMGLSELILIAIVGIIALGPEKLPDAMIKIAKTFNKITKLLSDAKDSIDDQINLDDINQDIKKYTYNIEENANGIMNELDNDDDEEDYDDNYDEDGKIIKEVKKKDKKNEIKKEAILDIEDNNIEVPIKDENRDKK